MIEDSFLHRRLSQQLSCSGNGSRKAWSLKDEAISACHFCGEPLKLREGMVTDESVCVCIGNVGIGITFPGRDMGC